MSDIEQARENTEPLVDAAHKIVDHSVASVAHESGRTVEEQWERMGDGFAYQAMEQHPNQKQLDDYAVEGQSVEVS